MSCQFYHDGNSRVVEWEEEMVQIIKTLKSPFHLFFLKAMTVVW